MALTGRWQCERREGNHATDFFSPLLKVKKGIDGFWIKRKNIEIVNLQLKDMGYNYAPVKTLSRHLPVDFDIMISRASKGITDLTWT